MRILSDVIMILSLLLTLVACGGVLKELNHTQDKVYQMLTPEIETNNK